MTHATPTDSIAIRRACPGDYDAIVAVWLAAGLPYSPVGREARESFTAQVALFGDLYLVAEDAGRIVGVVLGTHDGRKGWINRLAVLPEVQRRGVGARLIEACEDAIFAQGIRIIGVLIEPDNTGSCALFESQGYYNDVPARYYRKRKPPEI